MYKVEGMPSIYGYSPAVCIQALTLEPDFSKHNQQKIPWIVFLPNNKPLYMTVLCERACKYIHPYMLMVHVVPGI